MYEKRRAIRAAIIAFILGYFLILAIATRPEVQETSAEKEESTIEIAQ